jgi:hypothetical protein
MSSTGGGIVPGHNSVAIGHDGIVLRVSEDDELFPVVKALHMVLRARAKDQTAIPQGGTQPE